jgi:hypothetical protein
MPAKKQQNNKRVKRANGKNAVVGFAKNPPFVFPPMFRGCVSYTDIFNLNNLGSNAVQSYYYRANSVYDPNLSGTGSTSFGITQLAQLYDRYRVLNVTLEADFFISGTSTTTAGEVFVVASNNNSVSTGLGNWAAQRFVWRRPIGSASGSGTQRCRIHFPIHKVYGVPEVQVRNEDDFASVMGNNPNNIVYIHFGFLNNATASTVTCTVTTRLIQDTVFSLPVTLAA